MTFLNQPIPEKTRTREDQFISYWRSMLLARAFNQIQPPTLLQSQAMSQPYLVEPHVFKLQVPKEGKGEWLTLDRDAFLSGSAPASLVEEVFARLDRVTEAKNQEIREKNLRLKPGQSSKLEIDPIIANPHFEIEYAPCILRRKTDNRRFIPMFGVGTVTRNRKMRGFSPGEGTLPPPLWFRRLFMTPHDADVPLTIGDQAMYMAWVSKWLYKTCGKYDWPAMLELFDGSWKAACDGSSIILWAANNGFAIEAGFIREGFTSQINLAMHAAYGELREEYRYSPGSLGLFKNLVTGQPGPVYKNKSASYLGFLGDSWGLTKSQRDAVQGFVDTKDNQMLAVNGPPGTGKTTLLRTVMADLVVRSVVEGIEAPFIVACGATNQSVTNILEAFAGASNGNDLGPLEKRWIPYLTSYGSYGASSMVPRLYSRSWKHQVLVLNPFDDFGARKKEPSKYDIAKSIARLTVEDSGHKTAKISDLITVLLYGDIRPQVAWMDAFRETINLSASTNRDAIEHLRQTVKNLAEDILNYDKVLEAYRVSVSEGEESPEEDVKKAFRQAATAIIERLPLVNKRVWVQRWSDTFTRHLDQGLGDAFAAAGDVSLRRLAFHLAARYWEGRFLEHILIQNGLPGWMREVDAFRTLSMVMPCTVSTFDRLPALLRRSERGHSQKIPMWSEVDVLIVDEAGQAGPDKGALAFAYAKRSLVVGDVRQLSPVSDEDSPFFSQEIGEEQGILDEDAQHRGLLCGESLGNTLSLKATALPSSESIFSEVSVGSIMRSASFSSSWSSAVGDSGMWLYDHFRCEPTIIDYCNRLWYGGKLIPRTPKRERELGVPHLPPMSHLAVTGRNIKVGSSRTNPEEAAFISNWLVKNHDYLLSTFGKPGQGLDDIVAIVTPFSSQDRLLTTVLEERLGSIMGSRLKKLVHGTVHRMQGAERPVVIFSTVYSGDMFMGERVSGYFFDREPRLLNVAVSRAQKAFLVIGDKRVFDRAKVGTPTGHLREHLSFHEHLPYTETAEEYAKRQKDDVDAIKNSLNASDDWK